MIKRFARLKGQGVRLRAIACEATPTVLKLFGNRKKKKESRVFPRVTASDTHSYIVLVHTMHTAHRKEIFNCIVRSHSAVCGDLSSYDTGYNEETEYSTTPRASP